MYLNNYTFTIKVLDMKVLASFNYQKSNKLKTLLNIVEDR